VGQEPVKCQALDTQDLQGKDQAVDVWVLPSFKSCSQGSHTQV
jgi:hypothetical protein